MTFQAGRSLVATLMLTGSLLSTGLNLYHRIVPDPPPESSGQSVVLGQLEWQGLERLDLR